MGPGYWLLRQMVLSARESADKIRLTALPRSISEPITRGSQPHLPTSAASSWLFHLRSERKLAHGLVYDGCYLCPGVFQFQFDLGRRLRCWSGGRRNAAVVHRVEGLLDCLCFCLIKTEVLLHLGGEVLQLNIRHSLAVRKINVGRGDT